MSNFALDVNSSQGDIISSLNYALSNLGQGSTSTTGNLLTANVTTGVISTTSNSAPLSYLYQYMNVAYANTATGGGFTTNSTATTYYGIHNNTANIADVNPVDYQWTQVVGGFGTTKGLYYQTLGGRQITFSAGTTSPGYYFRAVQDNVPVNLDNVTSTQAVYTAQVYKRGNVTPATPTGGTYNFGNLFLNPPTGWSANVPPGDGSLYVFNSQNTFQSSQAFVNPPTGVWTFPTLFTGNGTNGTNGISTYNYTVYTATNFVPNTPLANTGSYNFTTTVGVPPTDPNYSLVQTYQLSPNWNLPPSTITFANTYATTKILSNTISNISYPLITNTYYTVYANTYNTGNVNTVYGKYVTPYDNNFTYGNAYMDTFTVTGNTSYVDIIMIGAGGDGDYIGNYPTHTDPPVGDQPYLQVLAAGSAGDVLLGSNVALPVGTYHIYHGAGVSTTITGPAGTWTVSAGNDGRINGDANIGGGNGSNIHFIGNSTVIAGNSPSAPILYTDTVGNLNDLWTSRAKGCSGGNGVILPYSDITWIGQNVSGNYYVGGGGASSCEDDYPTYGPPSSPGTAGYGGGALGSVSKASGTVTSFAGNATIGLGAGGGGGTAPGYGSGGWNNHSIPNPYGASTDPDVYNTFGGPGAIIIRQHNPITTTTLPSVAIWSNIQPSATTSNSVYGAQALAFTTNAAQTITTLAWQTPSQISGPSGTSGNAGPRGFVPMAYVSTSSDPTSYTTAQYTYAFSANRSNIATPIGTGYTPIDGDVAQFVYAPTNTITVKTFNANANVWTAVNGQVISGNVFVTGSVNATALNANDVYTLNLRGGAATVGNVSSPGFWMQASTGDARMAGNTSIGNNLTVGVNAVVGANLTVGANASIGTNLTVGANANIGGNLIIGANATIGNNLTLGSNLSIGNNTTIGNNLTVGNNTLIGNNLGVGNLAVIGNQLTVGANATIGNNLIVGNNALVGNNLGIGNLAVIGNQLTVGANATIGNNLTVGNNTVIGNNLYVGNNTQIGGNLTVAGLITGANLNANTVQTTTISYNSVNSIFANSVFTVANISSPTSNTRYAIGCNVNITTSSSDSTSFVCTATGFPSLQFNTGTGPGTNSSYYLYFYILVTLPDNTTQGTYIFGDIVAWTNFYATLGQEFVLTTILGPFNQVGTYKFYLAESWQDTGFTTYYPEYLVDGGRSLTIQQIKR